MIHSILIVNGTSEERQTKAFELAESLLKKPVVNHPDFLLIEDVNSIKINHVRTLQKKLALKPYQALLKIALLNEAEKLTLPAQHALLKTLEEPPSNSIIILTAPNKEVLLPTIVSRCQIIRIRSEKIDFDQSILNYQLSIINSTLSSTPGQRLLIAEKVSSSREQTLEFCQNQLLVWRTLLLTKTGILKMTPAEIPNQLSLLEIARIIHEIQQSLRFLESNVNHQLIVGNLLLSYPF